MDHKFSDNSFLDQGVLIQMGYDGRCSCIISYVRLQLIIPFRKAILGQGVEIHDLDFTISWGNCCIHIRAYCTIL